MRYYPPVPRYSDALNGDGNQSSGFYPGYVREGGFSDDRSLRFFSGTYQIGDTMFLDIALSLQYVRDFCGGYLIHSPVSQVEDVGWGPLQGKRVDRKCAHPDGIIDLRNCVTDAWPDTPEGHVDWVSYGYQALAGALAGQMLRTQRFSAVLAGENDTCGEVTRFVEAWQALDWIRPHTMFKRIVPHSTPSGEFLDSDTDPWFGFHGCREKVYEVGTTVDTSSPYLNANSGNEVVWHTLIVDPGQYCDDYGDFEMVRDHYDCSGKDKVNADIFPFEDEYARHCHKWIRRSEWRNG